MPLCSLHLISITPSHSVRDFTSSLLSSIGIEPLFIARPQRWMINPWIAEGSAEEEAIISMLRDTEWDIVVIFPCHADIPANLVGIIKNLYSLETGISSKILANLKALNRKLLDPSAPKPPLTGSLDKSPTAKSSKDLELTDELRSWFSSPAGLKTPPSMLNFLTFYPGKHDSYVKYGQAFAQNVGRSRGGLAKIVGPVIRSDEGSAGKNRLIWEEIAVAHYPTVWHFADMIMGEDYQKVNMQYRVGALRGTGILCCDELDKDVVAGVQDFRAAKAKL